MHTIVAVKSITYDQTIGGQGALSLDIWPSPIMDIVLGYTCVKTRIVLPLIFKCFMLGLTLNIQCFMLGLTLVCPISR